MAIIGLATNEAGCTIPASHDFINNCAFKNSVMVKEKKCAKCNEAKSLIEFYKQSKQKDGHGVWCKECCYQYDINKKRTKKGLIQISYKHQRAHSKRRGHDLPNYTKNELVKWAFSKPEFHKLYENWIKSEYNKLLIPSFDRKRSRESYSFDNLQIVTWRQNMLNGRNEIKTGANWFSHTPHKPVVGINMKSGNKLKYISIQEAGRNGFSATKVCACCKGKRKTHYGYKWEYLI